MSAHCAAGGVAIAATHIDLGLPPGPEITLALLEQAETEADPFSDQRSRRQRVILGALRRDLVLAFRIGGGGPMAVIFFDLGHTHPDRDWRTEALAVAAGVLWVSALLAALLSLDRLFQADFEDGSLDLIVLAPSPLEVSVLSKAAAH